MSAIRRAPRYWAAVLIFVAIALVGSSGPAAAQTVPLSPNPTDPSPVPVMPGPSASPAVRPCSPYPLCLVVPNDPSPQTPPTLDHPDPDLPILPLQDDPGHHAHANDMFNIDDGYGRDLRSYDLFANLPWLVGNPMPAIWLWLANLGFAVGKYSLGISVWFTEWSMTAGVFDWVKAPAQDLEQIWQTSIIGGLKLRQLALLIATGYLGLLFVRGRTTRAWRELFSTIAINVAAIAIITHPVDFLIGDGGVLSLSRDLGADVSTVIMGHQPGGTGNPAAPIGQAMIDNLLVAPWETLNYGTPITSNKNISGACQFAVKQVLDEGPWSSKEDSTKARELDGCPDDYGKYNETADVDRTLGAWEYAVAMLLFAILTICLNAVQILAPYLLLFEGLLLTLALVAAVVPSMQHQLAYRISSVAATIARLLASMFFIAVMTVLLRSIMFADLGPQLVRFAVIDLVVFSGFLFRKRLMTNVQKIRSRVNNSLQRLAQPQVAPTALPAPIVEPGPNRLGRTIKAGTKAFTESLAPVQQLKERMISAGRAGSKVLAYTVGAPVSWPAAANRASTALTAKGNAAKLVLGQKAGAAKQYAATYAGNLGKVTGAVPLWHAAGTAVSALAGAADAKSGEHRGPEGDLVRQVAALTPVSKATTPVSTAVTPAFTGTDLATGGSLPPGMLPPPTPWAQRLRERLDQHRETHS